MSKSNIEHENGKENEHWGDNSENVNMKAKHTHVLVQEHQTYQFSLASRYGIDHMGNESKIICASAVSINPSDVTLGIIIIITSFFENKIDGKGQGVSAQLKCASLVFCIELVLGPQRILGADSHRRGPRGGVRGCAADLADRTDPSLNFSPKFGTKKNFRNFSNFSRSFH